MNAQSAAARMLAVPPCTRLAGPSDCADETAAA
jgi:hypothetical protein